MGAGADLYHPAITLTVLAQAYLLTEDFLDGAPSAMILGDNIFFGHGLPEELAAADARETAARSLATGWPIRNVMASWISTCKAK